MNEAEWYGCTNPGAMLAFLGAAASGRKLTFFACACCRRGTIACKHSWEELWMVEKFADGRIPSAKFAAAVERMDGLLPYLPLCGQAAINCATYLAQGDASLLLREAAAAASESAAQTARVAEEAARDAAIRPYDGKHLTVEELINAGRGVLAAVEGVAAKARRTEEEAQCDLLRDLFGNPFRAPVLDAARVTPAIAALAAAAYARRTGDGYLAPAGLRALAEALEEAACAEQVIIDHLRQSGPHVRGCFALDLVRGP
jgi:hypothetical protein